MPARAVTRVMPFPVTLAFTLLLFTAPPTIRSASAQSGCGSYTIQGTDVQECYTAGDDYVTFSNSCGTETLTQSQLQAGAIPTTIIPCPQPQLEPQPEPEPEPQPDLEPPPEPQPQQPFTEPNPGDANGDNGANKPPLPPAPVPLREPPGTSKGGSDLSKCVMMEVEKRSASQYPYVVRNDCDETVFYTIRVCNADFTQTPVQTTCTNDHGSLVAHASFPGYSDQQPPLLISACNGQGLCVKPIFDGSSGQPSVPPAPVPVRK